MTFYNCNGQAIAYCEDDTHIYLFTGEPVAYFYENAVYGFNGHQFGWFEKGWIRDLSGACVFFTENATGSGPLKPLKCIQPMKCLKYLKPTKCLRELKRMKALDQLSWSALSGKHFFEQ